MVIIAIAGYIRDQRLLLLLFAGQFALIPYGYALEAELERVYAQNPHWRKWVLFAFLFVAAWILHVLLWFVLAQTTLHNIAAALPCTGWGQPDTPTDTPADYETLRTAFTVLLYFELVLFSLFGLVLPISMWRCRGCKIEDVWASNEALYAALNVTSKALLFVLIAIIVFGMPRRSCSERAHFCGDIIFHACRKNFHRRFLQYQAKSYKPSVAKLLSFYAFDD